MNKKKKKQRQISFSNPEKDNILKFSVGLVNINTIIILYKRIKKCRVGRGSTQRKS